MQRSFRVGASAFGVRTTSHRFGTWLDAVLGAYRIDDELTPEYSIVIDGGRDDADGAQASGRRFHILWQGVGQVSRTLHVQTLARSFLAELEAKLLPELTDAVYVHFSAVRSGALTALVPAWIVAYIQETGRRIERSGLTIPNRRWVAIDRTTGVVLPRPQLLDVPDDALELFEGWTLEEDPHRMDVTETLVADAVVTYVQGMDTVDVGTRGAALHRLAGMAANLPAVDDGAVHGLGHTVAHARAYEIGLGRPAQMVQALAAIFDHERAHADDVHATSGASDA